MDNKTFETARSILRAPHGWSNDVQTRTWICQLFDALHGRQEVRPDPNTVVNMLVNAVQEGNAYFAMTGDWAPETVIVDAVQEGTHHGQMFSGYCLVLRREGYEIDLGALAFHVSMNGVSRILRALTERDWMLYPRSSDPVARFVCNQSLVAYVHLLHARSIREDVELYSFASNINMQRFFGWVAMACLYSPKYAHWCFVPKEFGGLCRMLSRDGIADAFELRMAQLEEQLGGVQALTKQQQTTLTFQAYCGLLTKLHVPDDRMDLLMTHWLRDYMELQQQDMPAPYVMHHAWIAAVVSRMLPSDPSKMTEDRFVAAPTRLRVVIDTLCGDAVIDVHTVQLICLASGGVHVPAQKTAFYEALALQLYRGRFAQAAFVWRMLWQSMHVHARMSEFPALLLATRAMGMAVRDEDPHAVVTLLRLVNDPSHFRPDHLLTRVRSEAYLTKMRALAEEAIPADEHPFPWFQIEN